jgi:beta-lactamase superfamily II metal-dependent hydrolase
MKHFQIYSHHFYSPDPLPHKSFFCFFSQMLLGDAEVKVKGVKGINYWTRFTNVAESVGLVILSHHGSKYNWKQKFLSFHSNAFLWIASAGIGNAHNHPSKKVFDAVVGANRQFVLCNELQGLRIDLHT